jgi:hypothetical protein
MKDYSGSSKLFKPLPAIALAAAAIALAILVIWGTQPEEQAEAADVPSEQIQKKAEPFSSAEDSIPLRAIERPQTTQAAPEISWEENLDAILSGEDDNRSTVRRLLEGFDRLPPEAQTEYIAHALNLCEDDNYGEMEAIYLRSDTPAEVREQIFDDSLNRPDEIKLPMMARTMGSINHPLGEEAKEILVLYLDLEPDSVGPVDWNARVQAYLKENATGE